MTRRSILEYAQAIRLRYLRAPKVEKGKMLDEFMQVTGLHRKAVIRLLNKTNQLRIGKRRGRPRRYGSDVAAIYQGLNPVLLLNQINDNLEKLWRLTEHPSSVTRIMRQ